MLESIKQDWKSFKNAPPGERFKTEHERVERYPIWQRAVRAVAGVVITFAGVVMLFTPGPGTLVTSFGLALLSGFYKPLARFMDRTEPRLREWLENRKHTLQRLLHKAHA
jgi:uncharacterized membrane protein HdeD (DUF308 family)